MHTSSRRKATWLAFFVVTLSSFSVFTNARQDASLSLSTSESTQSSSVIPSPNKIDMPASDYNETSEAILALRQALNTLQILSHSLHSTDASVQQSQSQKSSLLQTFFPNTQGPIASALRILNRLKQQSWLPRFISKQIIKQQQEGVGGSGDSNYAFGKVKRERDEMRRRSVKVLDLLEHAIDLGNLDALFVLGKVSLLAPTPMLYNLTRSFDCFSKHADITGNATSQAMVAFFLSVGTSSLSLLPSSLSLPSAIPNGSETHTGSGDSARALLYYTFAASSGDRGAQMALGYRYWAGIGVNDDCRIALDWYRSAAEQSMAKFLSGPPGGLTLPPTIYTLSDLAGGAYGLGASVASTGLNAHRAVIKAASSGETWEDVLEYYMYNAERGDISYLYRVGRIFYHGSIYSVPGGMSSPSPSPPSSPLSPIQIRVNFPLAHQYFLRIARNLYPVDNPISPLSSSKKDSVDENWLGYVAASCSYLGRMYLRGEGVERDHAKAKMWFERGAEMGERESHNGLGIMYRDGLLDGGKKDIKKAMVHFGVAAGQELPEAQVNIGKIHYNHGEVKLAMTYFENAIRHGSAFEPYFYLAEIYTAQAAREESQYPAASGFRPNPLTPSVLSGACSTAVSFYKLVAEGGSWGEDNLMEDAYGLWKAGSDFGKIQAIVRWWLASERGVEAAQSNLAYVYDQRKSLLSDLLPSIFPSISVPEPVFNHTARLALTQYTRSASQRNIDALVKVGDYYFHGLGLEEEKDDVRWEKAAAYYQAAADTRVSAQAEWNLGWMYENGLGVARDFHLAKRHYDSALETNSEAYFAVTLSLVKLYVRSLWHTLKGGEGGLPIFSDDSTKGYVPNSHKEIDGTSQDSSKVGSKGTEEISAKKNEIAEEDDGEWYMGRAKEEHRKRMKNAERRARGEDAGISEWDRRAMENDENYYDPGPENFFDAALRGGRHRDRANNYDNDGGEDGEQADEFAETMLLVVLCLAVSVLLYIRGRWVDRRRREDEQANAANNNNVQGDPGVGAH